MTRRAQNKSTTVRSIYTALLRGLGWIHPDGAARLVTPQFFRTRRGAPGAEELTVLDRATPLVVESGGERLSAWSWGEGPTVLLVHGWNGRGSQLAPWVPRLVAAGHRVVAFDMRGHGRSPGSRSHIGRMADDVIAVADVVGPVHGVVAHSLGTTSVMLALERGLRARRLVFVAPAIRPRHWVGVFASYLGVEGRTRKAIFRHVEAEVGIPFSSLDLERTATTMDVPLLVVHDEDDRDVSMEEAVGLAAAWPGASLLSTHGLGHRRILADDGVIAEASAFLGSGAADGVGASLPRFDLRDSNLAAYVDRLSLTP